MNLQQLYYFQAICALKNYTRASEQLHIAQSSLSHSIADLEKELGVPLFFKVGRNIDITEYGKSFLRHVDRIIEELKLATDELQEMLDPDKGVVRLAISQTLGSRFIPQTIQRFYEEEGKRTIHFELCEKQAAHVVKALEEQSIDLGFGAKMDCDQLEYFHIFDEELVAVVSNRSPLASRFHVRLEDLKDEPLVTYTYNCGTRYWLDDMFSRYSIRPKISQEVDTEKLMLAAVASGMGAAIMPRIAELPLYDVAVLSLENSELRRPLYMCWPKDEIMRPVVKKFRDYVVRQLGR